MAMLCPQSTLMLLSLALTSVFGQAEVGQTIKDGGVCDARMLGEAACNSVSLLQTQSVWSTSNSEERAPLQNAGMFCLGYRGKCRKPGLCDWCGKGNACCSQTPHRRHGNPEICIGAKHTRPDLYECVVPVSNNEDNNGGKNNNNNNDDNNNNNDDNNNNNNDDNSNNNDSEERAPLQNAGRFCLGRHGSRCRTAGLCDWCGKGNACCSQRPKKRLGDPAICHGAKYKGEGHYQCVVPVSNNKDNDKNNNNNDDNTNNNNNNNGDNNKDNNNNDNDNDNDSLDKYCSLGKNKICTGGLADRLAKEKKNSAEECVRFCAKNHPSTTCVFYDPRWKKCACMKNSIAYSGGGPRIQAFLLRTLREPASGCPENKICTCPGGNNNNDNNNANDKNNDANADDNADKGDDNGNDSNSNESNDANADDNADTNDKHPLKLAISDALKPIVEKLDKLEEKLIKVHKNQDVHVSQLLKPLSSKVDDIQDKVKKTRKDAAGLKKRVSRSVQDMKGLSAKMEKSLDNVATEENVTNVASSVKDGIKGQFEEAAKMIKGNVATSARIKKTVKKNQKYLKRIYKKR